MYSTVVYTTNLNCVLFWLSTMLLSRFLHDCSLYFNVHYCPVLFCSVHCYPELFSIPIINYIVFQVPIECSQYCNVFYCHVLCNVVFTAILNCVLFWLLTTLLSRFLHECSLYCNVHYCPVLCNVVYIAILYCVQGVPHQIRPRQYGSKLRFGGQIRIFKKNESF